MSNLLVTVLAIALVAVTSATGIWYGGGAFIENQTHAQAQQLVNSAAQIASAWRSYAFENGGDQSLTDTDWTDDTATDLVPRYLSTLPTFNFGSSGHNFIIKKIMADNYLDYAADSNFLQAPRIPLRVCKQINLMATGDPTPYMVVNDDWSNVLVKANPSFCWTNGINYYFIYRVFK